MFFTWNKKISNNKTIKKNKAMKQKWKLWQFCTQKCSMRGSLGIMKIVLKMKKKSLLFSFECMKLHEIFIKTTDFTKFLNCCISMSKNVLFLENPNSHFYSFLMPQVQFQKNLTNNLEKSMKVLILAPRKTHSPYFEINMNFP